MKQHTVLRFSEFRYRSRGLLQPGDRFRVRGGPIYLTADGRKLQMAERGVFVFHRLCIQGRAQWIEAYRDKGGGIVLLWVGRSMLSPISHQLHRRRYKISAKLAPRTRV